MPHHDARAPHLHDGSRNVPHDAHGDARDDVLPPLLHHHKRHSSNNTHALLHFRSDVHGDAHVRCGIRNLHHGDDDDAHDDAHDDVPSPSLPEEVLLPDSLHDR